MTSQSNRGGALLVVGGALLLGFFLFVPRARRALLGIAAHLIGLYNQIFVASKTPPTFLLDAGDVVTALSLATQHGPDHAISWLQERVTGLVRTPAGRERVAQRWRANPLLERRLEVIDHALQAHGAGYYGVVAPTLLSQVEGVIVEAGGRTGWVNHREIRELLDAFADHGGLPGLSLREYANSVLFQNFTHGQPAPSKLSRHAVLHGGDAEFATEERAAEVIVVFDTIAEVCHRARAYREQAHLRQASPKAMLT